MNTAIPTLVTDRLILRAPARSDFPALAEFYGSPRSEGVGGPLDIGEIWRTFATFAGTWLIDGFGWWAVATRGTQDTSLGFVGIHHPVFKKQRELGWLLFAGAEGKGFACEAARAARDWARNALPAAPLVSYILASNTRSNALATRLGATPGGPANHNPDAVVWRHPGAAT